MIAQFPNFERLTLDSRQHIESVISKFPPYSDFNFVSLYSWDVKDNMKISDLNGNLIVLFKDYTSDKAFLSFIGENKVDDTIATLLEYASKQALEPALHLIPEHIIELIHHKERFEISGDRDNHDYLVVALKFSQLEGEKYASKRHGVNKFQKNYGHMAQVKHIQIDENSMQDIVNTFHAWRKMTSKTHDETADELMAVQRLMQNANTFDLSTLGIYLDDVMVAYSIYEVKGDYAIGHFEKAVRGHPGLYDFLKHRTAQNLHHQSVKYINYEQDLGIEGLRKSKLLLHPESFLKKFTVKMAK